MSEQSLVAEKFFFWLVIYSMIGWCYECVLESYRQKKIINRDFLNGPYCPIYGFGSLLDVIVLGWIKNPIVLFVTSAVLTTILEYITSVIMEKLFHVRWWDYNEFKFVLKGKVIDVGKFNINGRVCLVGALAFGTLSIILVFFLHPLIVLFTDKIPYPLFHYICAGLLLLIFTDTIVTVLAFSSFNDKLKALSANISQIKSDFKDNLDNRVQNSATYEKINGAYDKFVKNLNSQQIRLIKAFSQLRSIDYSKLSIDVKNFILRKKK